MADTIAESIDLAHNVVTRSKGKFRRARIEAASHQHVSKSNARGEDPHTNFAGPWRGQIFFNPLQNLGATQPCYHHTRIFLLRHSNRSPFEFANAIVRGYTRSI